MLDAEAYRLACDIADALRADGLPLSEFDAVAGVLMFRFSGARSQTIHADSEGASVESVREAYQRGPP